MTSALSHSHSFFFSSREMMNQSLESASSFTYPHQGVWGNGLCFSSCGGTTQFTRAYFCTTSTKPACHEALWQCETLYQIRRKTARATKHFSWKIQKQACVLWWLITPSGSADPNGKHPQETLTINTCPESWHAGLRHAKNPDKAVFQYIY